MLKFRLGNRFCVPMKRKKCIIHFMLCVLLHIILRRILVKLKPLKFYHVSDSLLVKQPVQISHQHKNVCGWRSSSLLYFFIIGFGAFLLSHSFVNSSLPWCVPDNWGKIAAHLDTISYFRTLSSLFNYKDICIC